MGSALTAHDCFAQATPGLERLVAAELVRLGVRPGRAEPGGVAFRATTRQLYGANLWLRTANRVLLRRATVRATSFAELERRLGALPWSDWIAPDLRPTFRVSSARSALYHTGAVAERFERVVGGPTDGPAQLVVVRVVDDQVVISLDTSGASLHRRGWRLQGAKAPLRETLAAAAVTASGWDGHSPLADPLCGSATIAIEAALAARDIAPGLGREFALHRWPAFEPGTWASVLGEARARVRPPGSGPPISAADRDPGAVEAARGNAERAGVAADVDIDCRPLSAFRVPVTDRRQPGPADGVGSVGGGGWVVTNPPYGARLGGPGDLRDLYATLGRLVDTELTGWGTALLVADPRLAGHSGLALQERLRTTNGGIPVRLLVSEPGAARPTGARARPARRPGARRGGGPGRAAGRRPPPAGRTG